MRWITGRSKRTWSASGRPIRDHHGNVIAALSISGPQRKINTPAEKQFVSSVVDATALISSKLGYLEGKE